MFNIFPEFPKMPSLLKGHSVNTLPKPGLVCIVFEPQVGTLGLCPLIFDFFYSWVFQCLVLRLARAAQRNCCELYY